MNIDETLTCISTGKLVTSEIENDLLKCDTIDVTTQIEFVEDRFISKPVSCHAAKRKKPFILLVN